MHARKESEVENNLIHQDDSGRRVALSARERRPRQTSPQRPLAKSAHIRRPKWRTLPYPEPTSKKEDHGPRSQSSPQPSGYTSLSTSSLRCWRTIPMRWTDPIVASPYPSEPRAPPPRPRTILGRASPVELPSSRGGMTPSSPAAGMTSRRLRT
eukprot:scaffold217113_cov36-Tisochrysis_lutea.AAC.3